MEKLLFVAYFGAALLASVGVGLALALCVH